MSFSDAIGQVDQIVQWEQQLADPAASAQATTSGTTAAASGAGATSASFSDALAQAQAQQGLSALSLLDPTSATAATAPTGGLLGASGTSAALAPGDLLSGGESQLLATLASSGAGLGLGQSLPSASAAAASAASAGVSAAASAAGPAAALGPAGGQATGLDDPRIQAMVQEADSLLGKPYVWGGGHDGWGPQSGYDCSGFVSAVLHAGGYLTSPQDTTTLPTAPGIEQGPGQYVTIYDRSLPGAEGHVIIEIDGQFYESGGQQGSWGGGGGVEKIETPSAAYLASFNEVLHPAGL